MSLLEPVVKDHRARKQQW